MITIKYKFLLIKNNSEKILNNICKYKFLIYSKQNILFYLRKQKYKIINHYEDFFQQ